MEAEAAPAVTAVFDETRTEAEETPASTEVASPLHFSLYGITLASLLKAGVLEGASRPVSTLFLTV